MLMFPLSAISHFFRLEQVYCTPTTSVLNGKDGQEAVRGACAVFFFVSCPLVVYLLFLLYFFPSLSIYVWKVGFCEKTILRFKYIVYIIIPLLFVYIQSFSIIINTFNLFCLNIYDKEQFYLKYSSIHSHTTYIYHLNK